MKNIVNLIALILILSGFTSCSLFDNNDDNLIPFRSLEERQADLCDDSKGMLDLQIEGIDWESNCLNGVLIDSSIVFTIADSTIQLQYEFLMLHSYKIHELTDTYMDLEIFTVSLIPDGERTYSLSEDGFIVQYNRGRYDIDGRELIQEEITTLTNNVNFNNADDLFEITYLSDQRVEGNFNLHLYDPENSDDPRKTIGSFDVNF